MTDDIEAEIRRLEAEEARAVLANDVAALEATWAEDILVNAPNNMVLRGAGRALALVRAGVIDYHAFDRTVDQVQVGPDLAVAMGQEVVQPKAGPHAGAAHVRRYTNVWRRTDRWRIIARHASVVPPQDRSLDKVAD